jgi:cystathionine beta-lyase/cystathionine gamma-synthase
MQISTQLIHEGFSPDEETGAVSPPVYLTSTYAQSSPGTTKGYDYTRAGNPNFTYIEKALAAIENASYASYFSSGLGATTALLTTLNPGDHVIALPELYGGTWRLFHKIFAKFGVEFSIVPLNEIEKALNNIRPKWLFFETPTNPLLSLYDIEHLSNLAHKYGSEVVVDNTFATPCGQQPLSLGADIVIHSTTKYISGHSDVIGGVLISQSKELKEEIDFNRMSMGLNASPFDAWLTLRGSRTLSLRMEKHTQNASNIADFLQGNPLVKTLLYPGLTTHPTHEIAKKQMKLFGGMLSIEFNMDFTQTVSLLSKLKYFTLAESLGGVESLVCHPSSMTHASIPKKQRLKMGISDGLIRFSVGIEDQNDLIEDLNSALSSYI